MELRGRRDGGRYRTSGQGRLSEGVRVELAVEG